MVTGLLLSIPVQAQRSDADDFFLSGKVVEQDSAIVDVHILNLSARTATITNAEGSFRMGVQLGDTLLISAVRYRRMQMTISQAMLEAEQIEIPLEPFVNALDEVVVSPYDLSGDLMEDLQRLPDRSVPSAISLGLPNARARRFTPTENRLNEATSGGGIVPLNPLLNAISGRTKQLKRQLAVERRYQKLLKWRLEYPDSVLTKRLDIPRGRIEDFLYFCEVDTAFEPIADSGDALQIWSFLRRKSEEYRKNNQLD